VNYEGAESKCVNNQEAKEVLMLYRPGVADESDPEFAEALTAARQDPELGQWFAEHCALQEALRAKFRQIPVPEGFKEQILSERPRNRAHVVRARIALVAASVVIALLVGNLLKGYFQPHEDKTITGLFQRMTHLVQVYPKMDLTNNNLGEIRRYLAANGQSGISLPKALENKATTGCASLHWQNKPVAMICFNSGRNADPNEPDLFLFVAASSDVPGSPPSGPPEFANTKKLLSATWSAGDKTYILLARGGDNFLRDYFPSKPQEQL
jgi:hypothetical protein